MASSDTHEFRAELKRHIAAMTVDAAGQMRIEGTLVGALDAVLKVVAGARWEVEYRLDVSWGVSVRVSV